MPAVLDPAPPLLVVGVSEGTVSVRRVRGRVVFIGLERAMGRLFAAAIRQSVFYRIR
jgi:hypothetical protein